MVDDYSELANGDFFEQKDGMVEPTCELFHLWQQAGMPVKVLRCDNHLYQTTAFLLIPI